MGLEAILDYFRFLFSLLQEESDSGTVPAVLDCFPSRYATLIMGNNPASLKERPTNIESKCGRVRA